MNLRGTEFEIPYTICFCIKGSKVLMVHRIKPPNANLWNGIGGKIEPGESLEESLAREVMEESGIDLKDAKEIYYAGVVTWSAMWNNTYTQKGMHSYIVELSEDNIEWETKDTDEGKLEWKSLAWVIDKQNEEVVENIPLFLPEMLKKKRPREYYCEYKEGVIESFTIHPLPEINNIHLV